MITTEIRLPEVTDDEQRLLNHLLKQLDDKTARNFLRASYYDGKRAIRQVGTIIPPQYYKLGIVLGWSAKAVDILARRCNLDGFVWPDGDLNSLGIREVWDANLLEAEINSGLVSSLIHSVSFLVNTVGGENEPQSLIHVKDAMNATGDWNWRARRLDNLLSITDRDSENNPTGLALYLDGQTITAVKEDGKWFVDRSEHPWGVPAEPLVYKPRVGRPFGSSRISRTVMSLHDQALRTVIRMEGHADVYSYPDMWLLGADSSIMKNPDGTLKPVWQFQMGRLKVIPDDDEADDPQLARAEIQRFEAASPIPHIEQLKQQAQLFSGETSIPLTSLGVSDMSNPTSSDSYIASREDLIAEAEGATDDWAPALRRTIIRALAIQNDLSDIPAEWATVDTKWRSPIHLSRAAQADAGMKQLSAVPWLADTEVGLELLGLSDQQITRAMSEKRRAVGRDVLATMQQRIAAQPPLTMRHRRKMTTPTLPEQVAVLTELAAEDLSFIWSGLSPQEATEALFDMLPAVIDTWATAAGALSADWYDNRREDNGIKGRFSAIVADLGDIGADALAGWATEPLRLDEPDWDTARSKVEGGVQRRITNTSRDTIMTSALEDPEARGWQRIARSGGCNFCVMLAGRGRVYRAKSARFGAHDHCHCSAVPAWGGQELPVKPYTPSGRRITDADKSRLREWISANQ